MESLKIHEILILNASIAEYLKWGPPVKYFELLS